MKRPRFRASFNPKGADGSRLKIIKALRTTVVTLAAAASVAFLSATPLHAEVYYTQDADGGYHFSNVPGPSSAAFVIAEPLARDFRSDEDLALNRRGPLSDTEIDGLIEQYATQYKVEPTLVKAVIRTESGFKVRAVSPRGARGLMQLMPRTARSRGCRNVYDASENIEAGVKHLRLLLDQYGNNLPRVLAAYNAGSEPVDRYHGIPPYAETQSYVKQVLLFRRQYLRQQRMARVVKP